jgi:hypothetical protein
MNRKHYTTSFILIPDGRDELLHCRGTMSPDGFKILCPKELDITGPMKILVRLPGPGIWVQVWGKVHQRNEGEYTARLCGVFYDTDNHDDHKLISWNLLARKAA